MRAWIASGLLLAACGPSAGAAPLGVASARVVEVPPAVVVAVPLEPVEAPPPPVLPEPTTPVSAALSSGLHNPMPGGILAGYLADTGLDIAGTPRPVFAIASGRLDYSEPGHTLWKGPRDTANCVRIELDEPLEHGGHKVTHVYYAHLSELAFHQEEGAKQRQRVRAGEYLGVSGVARGSPHLHLGFLLDGEVEQYWGTFLDADEVRAMLGPYRNGHRLPEDPAASALLAERKPAPAGGVEGSRAKSR